MPRVKVDWRMAERSVYAQFCNEHPEISLTFTQFQNIIYSFNEGFRDYIMETGRKGKLPWGFGDFAISKKKPRPKRITGGGKEVINLPIDWKKTNQAGKLIYHLNSHTEGYKFKIKWFLKTCRFRHSEVWTFKPSRASSRMIRHYITNGYQDKYYEWELTTNLLITF